MLRGEGLILFYQGDLQVTVDILDETIELFEYDGTTNGWNSRIKYRVRDYLFEEFLNRQGAILVPFPKTRYRTNLSALPDIPFTEIEVSIPR